MTSPQPPIPKVKRKVKPPPSIKEMTKGIDYSRKSEFQKSMNAGMEGKIREYLKKGENPIKPNLSGKEYEGPTKKYEKKKTKKKGRKSLRKINQRLA